MNEPVKEIDEKASGQPQSFAQISPEQVILKSEETSDPHVSGKVALESEQSLLVSTRILLREYGIRRSGASVRDAVESPHDTFGPIEAVSALNSLGFRASFG